MSKFSGRSYVIPASPSHRVIVAGFIPSSHTEAPQMEAVLDDGGALLDGHRVDLFLSAGQSTGHYEFGTKIYEEMLTHQSVVPLNSTALFFFLANPEFAAVFVDRALIVLFPGTIHERDGVKYFWGMMKGKDNVWSLYASAATSTYNKNTAFAVLRKKP